MLNVHSGAKKNEKNAVGKMSINYYIPCEIYKYIFSFMDGFERENMKIICKMFYGFKFDIKTDNPARDREVTLIDCNKKWYELFEYGHIDLIRKSYKRFGNPFNTLMHAFEYGYIEFARCIYDKYYSDDPDVADWLWLANAPNEESVDFGIQIGMEANIQTLKDFCRIGRFDLFEYVKPLVNKPILMTEFLPYACESGDMEIFNNVLRFSKESGSLDLDILLYQASIGGNIDIVQTIVCWGAINYWAGFNGACLGGHEDIAELMLSYDRDIMTNQNIREIMRRGCGGHVHIAKMLIRKKALNDENRRIGYYASIELGYPEMFEFLGNGKIYEDSVNYIRAYTGLELVEKILIVTGATENTFMAALVYGDLDMVKLVVKYGGTLTENIRERMNSLGDTRINKYILTYFDTL